MMILNPKGLKKYQNPYISPFMANSSYLITLIFKCIYYYFPHQFVPAENISVHIFSLPKYYVLVVI